VEGVFLILMDRYPGVYLLQSANSEVREVYTGQNTGCLSKNSRKGKKPRVYSDTQRAEMGKLTCRVGATEAAKRFTKKLGFTINESTMRSIKKDYLDERYKKRLREEDDLTISAMPVKKKRRPLLLGKKLDDAVKEYNLKLRDHGCAINTTVVIAVARGLGTVLERTRLVKYGGPATLSIPWAKSLLKRMDFTKRRVTTKSNPPRDDFEEVKASFLSEIIETVDMNDVPPELIFNWDQTGINLVPTALWTMDKRGKKRIAIEGYQDKRQITCVMCGCLTGELLPVQLIYAGKTNRCHPAYEFPKDWLISHTENHWANETTMLQYIDKVIVPYVEMKREALDLNANHPALAIFDHFKGQLTERVTSALEENNIHSVLIPAAYTGLLQPMDISVNKVVKSFLRRNFSEWYTDELTELFINDDDAIVDLSTARMKCIGGKWIVDMFEYLEDNPHVHGFRHAGVFSALGILDDDDLPEYENDEDSDLDEDDVGRESGKASEDESSQDEASDEEMLDTVSCVNVGSSLTVSAVYTASESDSDDRSTHGCPILISSDDDDED